MEQPMSDEDCDCQPVWLQLLLATIAACGAVVAEKLLSKWLGKDKEEDEGEDEGGEDETPKEEPPPPSEKPKET